MIQHFIWWAFLIGLAMGIVGIFFIGPSIVTVLKYPTPELANKLIYKDKNGICYKYTAKDVNCDANESRMKTFPLS